MPSFFYKAYTSKGRVVRGMKSAPGEAALAAALEEEDLLPYECRHHKPRRPRTYRGRIRRQDLIHFTEQLAIIIKSGIPILAGLEEIGEDVRHEGFRKVLKDIARQVAGGTSLSEALRVYPHIFDTAFVNVVEAGEETGNLDAALEKLAQQMAWVHDTAHQVRGALIQPAILLLAVAGLTVLVISVLVPKITELFSRQGRKLPEITRILMAVAGFLQRHHVELLGGLALALILWRLFSLFPRGRYIFDWLKLRIPIVGPVIGLFAASRFTNLFGLLNDSGVLVTRGLEIVSKATHNAVMDRGVDVLKETVMAGGTLSDGMKRAKVFPSLVARMVRIGERSGELSESLNRVCAYYDKEIPRALKRITTVLQPAILLFSAGIVAFVLFAAFMPIVRLVSGGL